MSALETVAPVSAAHEGEANQYLTFNACGEMFAIGILNVKEIIEYGTVTEIPMMPAFIRGVINLRGAVVPVVDLAARFGNQRTQVQRRTCIIILETLGQEGKQDLGIIVDAVSAVLEILPEDIEQAPSFGARIRTDYIAGMGKLDGRFVIMLNLGNVLSVEDMTAISALSDQDASLEAQPA